VLAKSIIFSVIKIEKKNGFHDTRIKNQGMIFLFLENPLNLAIHPFDSP